MKANRMMRSVKRTVTDTGNVDRMMRYAKRTVTDPRVVNKGKELLKDTAYETVKCFALTGTVDPKLVAVQMAKRQVYKGGRV